MSALQELRPTGTDVELAEVVEVDVSEVIRSDTGRAALEFLERSRDVASEVVVAVTRVKPR
jgi:hypothetical protein